MKLTGNARGLYFYLRCLLLLLAASGTAQAQFQYTNDPVTGGVTITKYTGTGGLLEIPPTLNGKPVTGIGASAFQGRTQVTSVTIPDSVETIGNFAFSTCPTLTNVVVGNGVTNIGNGAFYACSVLGMVEFGTNLTSIGAQAFQDSGLTSASLPNGVLTLGTEAFGGCPKLTNISLGNALTSMGDYAFFGCTNLAGITLPNSVNTVGVYAFSDCANLANVTLSASLTNISDGMFSSCGHLGTITIPSSVASIGSSAFFGCTSLIGVYFQGNAPTSADNFIFLTDASAKAYYLPGTSGWSATFAGIPAVLLNPTNPTGSLLVTISPAGAIANGAKFEVDGGPPQNSGETLSNLTPGSHIASFTPASGYTTPANVIVPVIANSLATVTGNYVPLVVPPNASLTFGPTFNRQINLGDTVAISLPFSDSIADATHTATLDWGDGTVESGLVDERTSTVSATHLYRSPDLFTIAVTLQANYGLTANALLDVTATASNAPSVFKVPALSIFRSTPSAPSAITLTWPQTGGSFLLEQSANVGSQADWVDAPLVPLASQGYFRALAPIDSTTRFFRLADAINTTPPSPSPLQLTISLPVTSFTTPFRTATTSVNLAGTVNDSTAVVTVQGVSVALAGSNWVANAVNLPQEGPNLILITATNLAGAQTVQNLVVTRDTLILPPLGLQALATGPTTVHLSWINGQPNVNSTQIYKRTTGASALIGTAAGSVTAFDDVNSVAGATAFYKAQAIDDLGNLSPFSPEVGVSQLGSGSAASFSLTGGSINSAGQTSSIITPTALVAPNPIRETNGDVRVRYLQPLPFGGELPGVTGYAPQLSRFELPGPPCLSWPDNSGNTERSLIVHVQKASSFGSALQVTVTPPPGWIISSNTFALPPRIGYGSFALNAGGFAGTFDNGVLCWGTYPSYPNPGLGPFPPPWASNRSLTFMYDAWTDTNATYSLSSNQLSFSVTSAGIKGTNNAGIIVSSGSGNIVEFGFALTLLPVDPLGCALDRTARLQISANGSQVEMGIGLQMDPDPFNLPCLRQSIDDAGGTLNIFTGDYSFQVPLFTGRGSGLNVEGLLSYSSVNASWDRAALQQSSPTNYSLMPLGPGWGYSYGMRLIRHDATNWVQGVPSSSNSTLIVVCPDGRVTQWPFNIVSNRYESLESATVVAFGGFSATYSSLVHPPAPLWAHFSQGVIVPQPFGGYVLREANQTSEGFQEIDFDDQGRMTNIVAQGGVQPISISYQGGNQIVTDSSGRQAVFSFDGSGRIIEVTDPSGGDWVLTYSGRALIGVQEKATGYSWQFAYDPVNYLLTERQLPHGFIVQASYDTAPVSNGRFFWGALTSTSWKETPSTSTRTIVYDRQNSIILTNNPSELFTPPFLLVTTNSARVSITTPSARNTSFFDIARFSSLLQNNVSAASYAMVLSSDQGSNTLRFVGTDVSAFWSKATEFSPTLANNENEYHTNALGNNVQLVVSGPYPSTILREDGASQLWEYHGTTIHSPTRQQLWRGFENDYQYFDPLSRNERLMAIFPPGQSPLNPGARSIQYTYDSQYRVQSVTDLDSNVTRMVYYVAAPKLGLPRYIVPCYDRFPSIPNPNTWSYDYDGLGRPIRVQDPNGNVTTNVYDAAGRLMQVLGPVGPRNTGAVPQTTYQYQGDLVTRVDTVTGRQQSQWVTYTYDNQMRLIEMNSPGNNGLPAKSQYAYDADNNTTNIIYPNGGVSTYTYDNRARLTQSVGPEGETVQHDYDDNTDEITETRQISGTNIRRLTVLSRDALRRPLEIALPEVFQASVLDRPHILFSYDQDGGITNRTYVFAGNSNVLSQGFGYFDELIQTTVDMGGKQSMTQKLISDYAGRLSQAQEPTLVQTGSVTGPATIVPQPNRQLPAVGNFTYNCFNSVSNITDGLNNELFRFGTDPKGLLQSVAVPDPSVQQPRTNARANTLVAAVGHDNFDLVSAATDVFGSSNIVSRDLSGRPTNIVDAIGTQSAMSWSAAGDFSSASTVSGAATLDTITSVHDDLGNTTQVLGPFTSSTNVSLTSWNYDLSGRPTNSVDPIGNVAAFTYNGFGEVTKEIYPSGAYITYGRDALGRVTNTAEYLPGQRTPVHTVSAQYDWQGNVITLSDENYQIDYTWDNLGRLLTKCTTFNPVSANPTVALARLTGTNMSPPITKCLTNAYGAFGDLVSTTDDNGYVRRYSWDDQDNLVRIDFVPPAGAGVSPETVLLHPDGAGELQSLEFQSAGVTVISNSITRDVKGRLKDLSYINFGTSVVPPPSYHYEYDARDLITNVVDSGGQTVTSYGYDQREFLTSEIWSHQADGTQFYNQQIGYDPAGNRIWRQLNGNLTTYTNDAAYRLVSANELSVIRIPPSQIRATADSTYGPGFEPGLATDGLAPDGDSAGTGWGSDTNAVDHWLDLALGGTFSVSGIELSVPTVLGGLQSFQIEVAPAGTAYIPVVPYQITDGFAVSTNAAGTYFHTVRVTFNSPQQTTNVRIVVPRGGNGRNPTSGVASPNVMINEIRVFQAIRQLTSYLYDPDGRLTNDGKFTYSYDVRGRLIRVLGTNADGLQVNKSWTITPEGLRGSETDDLTGQTRYFVNDGPNAYFEFTTNGGGILPVLRHLSAPGADNHLGILEYASGLPQFRWCLSQPSGNVAQVLDQNGNLLDARVYTAWGEDLVTSTIVSANPYGFAGARRDAVTGLYYTRARMYDPAVGRFTAKDPAGMIDGPNELLYACNNPVTGSDPSGLDDEPNFVERHPWFKNHPFLAYAAAGLEQVVRRNNQPFETAKDLGDKFIRATAKTSEDFLYFGRDKEYTRKRLKEFEKGPTLSDIAKSAAVNTVKDTLKPISDFLKSGDEASRLAKEGKTAEAASLVGASHANILYDLGAYLFLAGESPGKAKVAGGPEPVEAPRPAVRPLKPPPPPEAIEYIPEPEELLPDPPKPKGGLNNPKIIQKPRVYRSETPGVEPPGPFTQKVKLSELRNPPSKPVADPDKLKRLGEFNPAKYERITVERKKAGFLEIQEGVTRVQAAKDAGITELDADVYPEK